jgi:hypothetical protein
MGEAINVDLANLSSHGCDPFYRGSVTSDQHANQLLVEVVDPLGYLVGLRLLIGLDTGSRLGKNRDARSPHVNRPTYVRMTPSFSPKRARLWPTF